MIPECQTTYPGLMLRDQKRDGEQYNHSDQRPKSSQIVQSVEDCVNGQPAEQDSTGSNFEYPEKKFHFDYRGQEVQQLSKLTT